jgi:hypothetical protein
VSAPPRYLYTSARGGSTRSTLDLLALPLPFTQTGLLSPREFRNEASRRGVRLDDANLEILHRTRLLVPFFEVSLGPGDVGRIVDFSHSETPNIARTTYISELYRAAAEGRARDLGVERFHRWSTRRARTLWPTMSRGVLYSWHQLLGIRWLKTAVTAMRYDRTMQRWTLPAPPTSVDLAAASSWRELAVTLSAIDARYWPLMTHKISHDADVWRDFNQRFDVGATLTWAGVDVDAVGQSARELRELAGRIDLVGDFYDVIRRAHPDAWETLRDDALVAMDLRMAAEALDTFADDAGRQPEATEEARTPLREQRLSARPHSTDEVLTDLGVSPHPSLVIGVEGATEARLLPRVFEALGVPLDDDWIRIVDFGGVGKELSNLAKFAAAPSLGRDHGDYVDLVRPITRFLVLVDAEGKYRTPANRAKHRRILLDAVCASVPADLRGDLYGADANLVEIRTWGRLPLEFANFTDAQLARGLIDAAVTPYPRGKTALTRAVHAERARPVPNIERVWSAGAWPGANLSKVRLAEACWPMLERKIERAIASGSDGPPLMRAAVRAWELAVRPTRRNMALQRRKTSRQPRS